MADRLPATEAGAYEALEWLRWGGPPAGCPLCGADGRCRFLRPGNGRARSTRTGAITERRVWRCAACRRQFSVLAGTVLQGTRISVRAWLGALTDWAAGDPRPTAADLVARHGVSRAAARHIVRRLGLADAALAEGARANASAATLLRIPPDQAARIRDRTPTRVRPRRQVGATADYGS